MNDLAKDILRTRVRIPPPPPLRGDINIMFKWFKRQKNKYTKPNFDFEDTIEETLWEIKQEYDLETEEVEMTVFQKRHYINYMNECTKKEK